RRTVLADGSSKVARQCSRFFSDESARRLVFCKAGSDSLERNSEMSILRVSAKHCDSRRQPISLLGMPYCVQRHGRDLAPSYKAAASEVVSGDNDHGRTWR